MSSARCASSEAPTAASLPNDLLVNVLSRLQLADRQRTAPLVCRGWERACYDERLLRTLAVTMYHTASTYAFLRRLFSLAEWFAAHAAKHVQQLKLSLSFDAEAASDTEWHEVTAVLTSMLAGCCAGGQLAVLRLDLQDFTLPVNSWLAPLGSSLQTLSITTDCAHLAVGSLHTLTVLRELELREVQEGVTLLPTARLPQGLTKMKLSNCFGDQLPQQVGGLPRLADLTLLAANFDPEGFAPLMRLSSLQRLEISCCTSLPTCLPELSWLEELSISTGDPAIPDQDTATLTAALPQLMALTSLVLRVPEFTGSPAALHYLPRLRRLVWWAGKGGGEGSEDEDSGSNRQTLPDGAWLGSIERLVAPPTLLANSLRQLSGAPHLTHLGVADADDAPHAAAAVVRWAARAPCLQRLVLQAWQLPAALANAALHAQRCRPGLCMEVGQEAVKSAFGENPFPASPF